MSDNLFDKGFLGRLERVKGLLKKVVLSGTAGERVSRQKGGRIEFIDHRAYTPGDEPRYVDWNLFGRTERLFVKEFASEQAAAMYILLDESNSMRGQLGYVRQLAVVFGYAGLVLGGRVSMAVLPAPAGDKIIRSSVFQSEQEINNVIRFMGGNRQASEAEAKNERTNISIALEEMDKSSGRKGVLIVISDLLEDNSDKTKDMLMRLAGKGLDVHIMHITAEREGIPVGTAQLRDSETGELRLMEVTPAVHAAYQRAVTVFSEDWRHFCLQHNVRYYYIRATMALEDVLLQFLRAGGFLR
jgi:uncharacterized protein (DUF58 family)